MAGTEMVTAQRYRHKGKAPPSWVTPAAAGMPASKL
jgi:hypothetical protein